MAGDQDISEQTPDVAAEMAALRAKNEKLEGLLLEARESSDRRAIGAELKAEALRRGMVDLDGLKLLDAAELSIDSDGAVRGVTELITKMRRDKPWLFGSSSSSSVAGVPASSPSRTKLATEMSLSEWRTARAELLRRG